MREDCFLDFSIIPAVRINQHLLPKKTAEVVTLTKVHYSPIQPGFKRCHWTPRFFCAYLKYMYTNSF